MIRPSLHDLALDAMGRELVTDSLVYVSAGTDGTRRSGTIASTGTAMRKDGFSGLRRVTPSFQRLEGRAGLCST